MIRIPVEISNSIEKYEVVIANDVIGRLEDVITLSQYTKIVVITDTVIAEKVTVRMLPSLPKETKVIAVSPGEISKTIDTATHIWNQMIEFGMDRKSLVINVGGGVVTDLGGFVASLYMRGIDFIQIPTTLLAQVDASVGGKTGINMKNVKNSIGTFSQPKIVIIDIKTLETLPDREFISGFAEILKHGLIHDAEYFQFCSIKKPREYTMQEIMNIVERSVKIKADIVAGDVRETGISRKQLNFGHTIGHAIEALLLEANTPILHGEAISLGMMAESVLSELQGTLTSQDTLTIQNALVNAGLPVTIKALNNDAVIQKMKFDKKNEGGVIQFTLLRKIGEAITNVIATPEQIEFALRKISQ